MYYNNPQYQDSNQGNNQYNNQYDNQYQNQYQQDYQAMDQQQAYDDQTEFVKLCDQTLECRSGFVKKTYALLTLELGLTLGLIALAMYTTMGNWYIVGYYNVYYIHLNPYTGKMNGEYYVQIEYTAWFWISWFMAFGLQIALFCCHGVARKVPTNYIFTLLYIFCFGSWLSGVCLMCAMFYGSAFIWTAWGITFSLVFSLTIYACLTKSDLTIQGGAIFVIIPCILFCLFLSIFNSSYVLFYIISSLIICLYGFYLLWETQMIMGKGKIKLSIDDYIIGSLLLYGTIIQMFIRILEIMAVARGGRR